MKTRWLKEIRYAEDIDDRYTKYLMKEAEERIKQCLKNTKTN